VTIKSHVKEGSGAARHAPDPERNEPDPGRTEPAPAHIALGAMPAQTSADA